MAPGQSAIDAKIREMRQDAGMSEDEIALAEEDDQRQSALADAIILIGVGIVVAVAWIVVYVIPNQERQDRILDCVGDRDLTQELYLECQRIVDTDAMPTEAVK